MDGSKIPTETVIWTAGVRGETSPRTAELLRAYNGCIRVLPSLQIAGHPEVYVIGSANEPGLTHHAIADGSAIARRI